MARRIARVLAREEDESDVDPLADREPWLAVLAAAALVPPRRFHLLRYHGAFAPMAAWRSRIVPHAAAAASADERRPGDMTEPGPPASGPRPGATARPRYDSWAELMMRVFAKDVLECPRCGSPLRILAAIHPPDTTRAILECLGLSARPPPIAPARPEPQHDLFPARAPPAARGPSPADDDPP